MVTVAAFVTTVTKLDTLPIGPLFTQFTSFYYGYICKHA